MTDIQTIHKGFALIDIGGALLSQFGTIASVVHSATGIYEVHLSEPIAEKEASIDIQVRNSTNPLSHTVWPITETQFNIHWSVGIGILTDTPFSFHLRKIVTAL